MKDTTRWYFCDSIPCGWVLKCDICGFTSCSSIYCDICKEDFDRDTKLSRQKADQMNIGPKPCDKSLEKILEKTDGTYKIDLNISF